MTHDLVTALCWGVIGSVMVVAAGVTAMIYASERSDHCPSGPNRREFDPIADLGD